MGNEGTGERGMGGRGMGDGELGNGGARGEWGKEEMRDGGEGTGEVCPIL
jgi:hypothetical protein